MKYQRAIQKRAFTFALLVMLVTGFLVSLAGFWPLFLSMRDSAQQRLSHIHALQSVSLLQYHNTLQDIARQVSSRSAIRQALAEYQDGRRSLEDLQSFTAPRLSDAVSSTDSLLAVARFAADGALVAMVKEAPALASVITQASFPAERAIMPQIGTPVSSASTVYIPIRSPIYDSAPGASPPRLLGYDVLVFSSTSLADILHQHGKDMPLAEYLAFPTGGSGDMVWFTRNNNQMVPAQAPAPPASHYTVLSHTIDHTPWILTIVADNTALYAPLYESLTWTGAIMLSLLLAGGLLLAILLRPLHGHLLVHTQDLEEQINTLKTLGDELEKERARLTASNLELEHFAYAASHDLQQPLRMISSFLDLLRRRYSGQLDAEAQEFIGFAVEGAGRMRHMITDLLEYSRVGRIEKAMAPLALGDAVQAACDNLALRIAEYQAVMTIEPLPTVTAEVSQMTRVFQNLIDNALKYAMPGRIPEIRIDCTEPVPSADDDGLFWLIRVKDNGIGIDPAAQKNAFRLFQRLHTQNSTEGTGMGLAMCAKIIAHHGGKIWLESTPEVGTTICFTLPRAADHGVLPTTSTP